MAEHVHVEKITHNKQKSTMKHMKKIIASVITIVTIIIATLTSLRDSAIEVGEHLGAMDSLMTEEALVDSQIGITIDSINVTIDSILIHLDVVDSLIKENY